MDPSHVDASMVPGALAIRANRFVRGFALQYGGFLALSCLLLGLLLWPGAAMAPARLLVADALHGGLALLVLTSLMLSGIALLAVLLLTAARQQGFAPEAQVLETPDARARALLLLMANVTPATMARQGQAALLALGALVIVIVTWVLSGQLSFQPLSPNADLAAGFAIFLAFPSLIAERMAAGFPVPQLPEAPALRRVLLFTTVALGLAGLLQIGRGAGLDWLEWPIRLIVWLPALVAIELGLRAVARYFAPPPSDSDARAAIDSILLTLLTAGPRNPSELLREHLGLDFARSWALAYLKSAALPAMVATILFCWCLSGLKLIAYDERGVYERLGAPVGVMGPGLHLLLPWPLGHLRPVEYGRTHTIIAGLNEPFSEVEPIGAEATAPSAMNRLWETRNPTEVEYLVASQSSAQQSFQAVSAEVRILYRIGLTDDDALQSVYAADDPVTLVKVAAGALETRYFASHTLDDVMGARRDALQEQMRAGLARDLRAKHAGIEITAVVIEAIHPPAGAAQAYHAVQAAEINADASVADETARAEHTLGTAQQEAIQTLDAAEATAAETVARANADAYRFGADVRSSQLDRSSFLLERRFANLIAALAARRLIIMDNHITPAQEPLIDMRPPAGQPGTEPSAANAPSSPTATPGTSTESNPPPMTSEEANEEMRRAQKPRAPSNDDLPPNLQ